MSLSAYAIRDTADGCTLAVIAKPRARRTAFAGFAADAGTRNGALRVRLQAPPVNGKANEELIRFLAKQLGVPQSAVTTEGGRGRRPRERTGE